MSELFKNKYRIDTARAQWWDYGWNAPYFVTICVRYRECSFGYIENKQMYLSGSGEIATGVWTEIFEKFSYAKPDEFVVMPNHIHGVIHIDNPNPKTVDEIPRTYGVTENNPMVRENLSRVLQWYKAKVTIEIRKINPWFEWLDRFYDIIIRDEKSYQNIRNYIQNNPANWEDDKFYKGEI